MKLKYCRSAALLSTIAMAAVGLGCGGGGATNNDQGVAVTLLGFFSEFPEDLCEEFPDGLAGITIPIGQSGPEPTQGDAFEPASGLLAILGVQNNLYGQYFRTDRVLFDYYIPGAQVQPPSTNIPLSMIAGPAQGGDTEVDETRNPLRDPNETSLPPSFNSTCNRSYAQTTIIPAAVREWLNFHRDQLPEPPFQMTATARLTGMTSAGDRFETQAADLLINISPETTVTPTEGTDEGGTDAQELGPLFGDDDGGVEDIDDGGDDVGGLGGVDEGGTGTDEGGL